MEGLENSGEKIRFSYRIEREEMLASGWEEREEMGMERGREVRKCFRRISEGVNEIIWYGWARVVSVSIQMKEPILSILLFVVM